MKQSSNYLFVIVTILFIIISPSILSCQEKYEKEIIFLGEYNDQNELKVFKEDSVVFINKDSLSQVDQFKAEELIKLMEANELYFIGEGDEPFWQFKIIVNFTMINNQVST